MLTKLAGFSSLLRQAGVRVSPGETEDFLKAVWLTGLEKGRLESAALATLAKGENERRVVKRLFDLYFNMPANSLAARQKCDLKAVLRNPPALKAAEFESRLAQLRSFIRQDVERYKGQEKRGAVGRGQAGTGRGRAPLAPLPDRLWHALGTGSREEMKALAQEAVRGALEKADPATSGFEELFRQVKLSLDWAAAVDRLEKESQQDSRSLLNQGNVQTFERLLLDELERELWRRCPGAVGETAGRANLAETDFSSLNLDQVEEIKKAVARMARSLAARVSYRRARSGQGEVDLRRTARQAAQTGGAPLKLCYRARLPHRPDLVVLCDLSGSVSRFTGFMLQLIYAVQERFSRVRTFAFVDDVEEITGFLKGREPGEAIVRVLREARIARTPFSDYGAVWKEFSRKHLDCITAKTTVLILGDGRSNWKPPGVEHLEQVRDRAARLIWLNPSPRERWDKEDSIIDLYRPYCHRLLECRNLRQLQQAARYLGQI